MAEEVPRETESGPEARRVVIAVGRITAGWIQAWHVQALHATTVNKGVLARIGQNRIEVADVAEIVVERAEHLDTKTKV